MWIAVGIFVVSLLYVATNMPKSQTQKPAGFSEVTVPTCEEGREIPVLFGTKDIEGPNIVWYGDFGTQAVRK